MSVWPKKYSFRGVVHNVEGGGVSHCVIVCKIINVEHPLMLWKEREETSKGLFCDDCSRALFSKTCYPEVPSGNRNRNDNFRTWRCYEPFLLSSMAVVHVPRPGLGLRSGPPSLAPLLLAAKMMTKSLSKRCERLIIS